jgi:hypothetical protein
MLVSFSKNLLPIVPADLIALIFDSSVGWLWHRNWSVDALLAHQEFLGNQMG